MSALLKQAFDAVSLRPQEDQDYFAQMILDELQSDIKWDEKLSGSASKLDELAAAARQERKEGKTLEGGFGRP